MKSKRQKYEQAVDRNLTRFLERAIDPNNALPPAKLVNLGLNGLKTRLGIRENDNSHNEILIPLLKAADKSLAKETEAKRKHKGREAEPAKEQELSSHQNSRKKKGEEKPPFLERLFGKRSKSREKKLPVSGEVG